MYHPIVKLILINILVCSHQQKITLFDYRQGDSSTKCTDGLICDIDTIVFKSGVEYSQDPTMEHVFFFMKRKIDEIFILEKQYNIQTDCSDVKSSDCTHIDELTVEISLHIKASKDISGARLRGKLITSSQKDIFSDDQIIPEIYGSKDHNAVLVINGEQQNVENDECNYNVSNSDVSIFFMLESKLSPFYIEMSSKDPYIHVQGKGHAEYHLKTTVSDRFNLTIKYFPCRIEGPVNTIQCNIQNDDAKNMSFVCPGTSSDTSIYFNPIVLFMTIIIIGLISLTAYLKMRLHKTRSKTLIVDQGTRPPLKPDQSPHSIVESFVLNTICETDAPCHTVKEPIDTCTTGSVDDDDESKHDKKIEHEPVEKQEMIPLIQQNDKTKGSPLPKEDNCENKEEEAKEAHNSFITMNRYLTLTAPGNSERDNGRVTRQENNVDELLDMLGVKKK